MAAARTPLILLLLATSTSSLLLLLLLLLVQADQTAAVPLPPACDDGRIDVQPRSCTYGRTMDACGKRVCQKGPGEMCGGTYGRYGICADGLMCSNCNRCQGCSFRTFMCWDDRSCIW